MGFGLDRFDNFNLRKRQTPLLMVNMRPGQFQMEGGILRIGAESINQSRNHIVIGSMAAPELGKGQQTSK